MKQLIWGIKKYMLLERLELTALGLSDLCYVLLTTPYIMSSIIGKKIRILERERNRAESNRDERRRVQLWLSRLKKNGFVEQEELIWKLTKMGYNELHRLGRRIGLAQAYKKQVKSDNIKIISFDIPEKIRGHRDWLRCVLKNLGFTMLHKSVWMGKILLPKAFIEELQFRKITEYVEIIGITKQGSIRKEIL